jgi:hypothetical protein
MMTTIRVLFGSLLLAMGSVHAASAGTQTFPSNNGQVDFVMPSQNVECIYTPAGGTPTYTPADGGPELQCDRAQPTYLRFVLGKSGPATVISDVGDASCCGGTNVLQYGSTWKGGPFACRSATTGIACTRGAHGFLISKAKVKTY